MKKMDPDSDECVDLFLYYRECWAQVPRNCSHINYDAMDVYASLFWQTVGDDLEDLLV